MIKPCTESEFSARRKAWQESYCLHLIVITGVSCLQKFISDLVSVESSLWQTILISLIPVSIVQLIFRRVHNQGVLWLSIAILSVLYLALILSFFCCRSQHKL